MTVWLEITGILLLLSGIAFCVLPVIPGQLLAFAAIVLKYFFETPAGETSLMLVSGLLIGLIIVTILDVYAPVLMIKKAGGSKNASRGAIIGTIAGIVFTPIGMLLGMFLGAFIGELITDNSDAGKALKAAVMTFLGFLLSTGLKLLYVFACLWFFFA